jgi:hypothetical protein
MSLLSVVVRPILCQCRKEKNVSPTANIDAEAAGQESAEFRHGYILKEELRVAARVGRYNVNVHHSAARR